MELIKWKRGISLTPTKGKRKPNRKRHEHCQEAEAISPQHTEMLLRALSLLGMTGREGGQQVIFIPISTRQHQNLYRHQPLTKHKEERQQLRAADQHLRGLDDFNSLQSLPKIPFLTLLRKISSKRDGQPSRLVPKPCASSQLAVPASPATAAGQMRWFSWVKGCG